MEFYDSFWPNTFKKLNFKILCSQFNAVFIIMIAIEIYVICIMYMFMYIFGSSANMETKPGAVTLLIKWTLLFYCCVFLCVFFKTIYKHRDFLIVSLKKHTLYIFVFKKFVNSIPILWHLKFLEYMPFQYIESTYDECNYGFHQWLPCSFQRQP